MGNPNDFITFNYMYKALKIVCRNVRWKTSVTQYEMNGLKNTAKNIREIRTGKYKLQPYQEFDIYEPKFRHITATRIKDRQVQRSLCDAYVYEAITKSFIYANGACQIDKGTLFVAKEFKKQLRKYYQKQGNSGYYLKCDIHKFFDSIDHDYAKYCIAKRVSDPLAQKLLFDIIDSFKGNKGIGLGSQISQLVALSCLDDLDHAIKESYGISPYIRYMDDFILVDPDKEKLKEMKSMIEAHLNSIGLTLNTKTTLQPIKRGILFLNWKYHITDTGKVVMIPDKHRLARKRRKIKKLLKKYQYNALSGETLKQITDGMIAHLKTGNATKAIKEIQQMLPL